MANHLSVNDCLMLGKHMKCVDSCRQGGLKIQNMILRKFKVENLTDLGLSENQKPDMIFPICQQLFSGSPKKL